MIFFSGMNASISIDREDSPEIDAVSVEFSAVNNSRPLYTPGSDTITAFMDSTALVQGTLILNHTDTEENKLKDEDTLSIDYSKEAPILQNGVYEQELEYKRYTITEIQVISENHSLSPITDNLTDIYQFIGKELAITPEI